MFRRWWPVVAGALYWSGAVPLVRWCQRLGEPRLVILNYHRCSEGDLRRHFEYLRRHYRVLPLEEALAELRAPRYRGRGTRVDRRMALAITFDDGYYDQCARAAALANEMRVPITIYLVPGYIASGRRFWWYEAAYLTDHTAKTAMALGSTAYGLATAAERKQAAAALDHALRTAPSVAAREALLDTTREELGVADCMALDERPAASVTWAEARVMAASPWVAIGAHTLSHPTLAYLEDPAEIGREVKAGRTELERALGRPVRTFAYPIGGWGEIGDASVAAVKRAGLEWAVTTIPGFNTASTDSLLLRRIPTDTCDHWTVIAAQAAGVWHVLAFWLRLPTRVWRRPGWSKRAGRGLVPRASAVPARPQ